MNKRYVALAVAVIFALLAASLGVLVYAERDRSDDLEAQNISLTNQLNTLRNTNVTADPVITDNPVEN